MTYRRGKRRRGIPAHPWARAPDFDHISVNVVDLDPLLGVAVRQAVLPLDSLVESGLIEAAASAAREES